MIKNSEIAYITGISGNSAMFKGCPLRCPWCPWPENRQTGQELFFNIDSCDVCGKCRIACGVGMQKTAPSRIYDRSFCTRCGLCVSACPKGLLKLTRKETSADEILAAIDSDVINITGGEAAMQYDALLSLIKKAKQQGKQVHLKTCGMLEHALIPQLCQYVDLFVFDLFDTDAERFKKLTRGDLDKILTSLHIIDSCGGNIALEFILIGGYNTGVAHAEKFKEICACLKNLKYKKVVPYTGEGREKFKLLDIYFNPECSVPTEEEIAEFNKTL